MPTQDSPSNLSESSLKCDACESDEITIDNFHNSSSNTKLPEGDVSIVATTSNIFTSVSADFSDVDTNVSTNNVLQPATTVADIVSSVSNVVSSIPPIATPSSASYKDKEHKEKENQTGFLVNLNFSASANALTF